MTTEWTAPGADTHRHRAENIAQALAIEPNDVEASRRALAMIDGGMRFLANRHGDTFAAETAYQFADHFATPPELRGKT